MTDSRPVRLITAIHRDERGAVSLETVLIIGAIALPILVFLLRFGWPRIRGFFSQGMDELDSEIRAANSGG